MSQNSNSVTLFSLKIDIQSGLEYGTQKTERCSKSEQFFVPISTGSDLYVPTIDV